MAKKCSEKIRPKNSIKIPQLSYRESLTSSILEITTLSIKILSIKQPLLYKITKCKCPLYFFYFRPKFRIFPSRPIRFWKNQWMTKWTIYKKNSVLMTMCRNKIGLNCTNHLTKSFLKCQKKLLSIRKFNFFVFIVRINPD